MMVGVLNTVARKYEDDGTLTKVGAGRSFGYSTSTISTCTGTLSASTCPNDTGYINDYNLVVSVLGTAKVSCGAYGHYYATSRQVHNTSYGQNNCAFGANYVDNNGKMSYNSIWSGCYGINYNYPFSANIRPIIFLKPGLSYAGSGTSTDPWVPSAS